MECNLSVGQKVVCIFDFIKNNKNKNFSNLLWPIKDQVYTIREIGIGHDDRGKQGIGLRFIEIKNDATNTVDGMCEQMFDHACFKPLVTTNIDIFTKMLTKIKEDA
jgi:hypothetical protein